MRTLVLAVTGGALATACASPVPGPASRAVTRAEITPFSSSLVGTQLPLNWQSLVVSRANAPTRYETVFDPLTQRIVLKARAERACTGLRQPLSVDPSERPRVAWEWRVEQLVEGADNSRRDAEDSPVRLMLFFDGDRNLLAARERAALDLAHLASGEAPPVATLTYIWENRQAVGTLMDSPFTGRVKMIVAGSAGDMLGDWKRSERNHVEDYRRAFGHAPGRLWESDRFRQHGRERRGVLRRHPPARPVNRRRDRPSRRR